MCVPAPVGQPRLTILFPLPRGFASFQSSHARAFLCVSECTFTIPIWNKCVHAYNTSVCMHPTRVCACIQDECVHAYNTSVCMHTIQVCVYPYLFLILFLMCIFSVLVHNCHGSSLRGSQRLHVALYLDSGRLSKRHSGQDCRSNCVHASESVCMHLKVCASTHIVVEHMGWHFNLLWPGVNTSDAKSFLNSALFACNEG